MKNHQFNIFFSWQSDIKENRSIISNAIKTACKKLKDNEGYSINIDDATRDRPGSPVIESSVKSKIDSCDIFIADITPITYHNNKLFPNSNVMFELGYAMRCMEIDRIIIISRDGNFNDKDFPFDINHHRICKFSNEKINLDNKIKSSIEYVLNNGKFQYSRLFNDSHLKQNKSIGKYLPDVFLEDSSFKENLRCFVHPFFMYQKIYKETVKLNFNYYNHVCKLKEKKKFNFSISSFPPVINELSFTDFKKNVDKIISYLNTKITELEQYKNNLSHYTTYKIRNILSKYQYLNKRICLIKGKAGQGKTNIISDIVENIFLKHNIPFVYLNGYEIDANNIGNTLVRSLYPEENYSLGEILRYAMRFCYQQTKPFVIIIDGLNEHHNSILLKNNLQEMINSLLVNYDFVKIIITCRTEYYDANFHDLLQMYDDVVVEHISYSHIDEENIDLLIEDYCEYFNIHADFSEKIKVEFGNNLLLLRIYCETYQNQDVGSVIHIKKDNLFKSYYTHMLNNLTASMQKIGFKIEKYDIRLFTETLVKLMIEKDSFSSIPINDVLNKLNTEHRNIFKQFIDTNIIIKRELNNNLFSSEVINFTFDEFRDFMISHYLIDEVYKTNINVFENKIYQYTQKEHILREGLTCFLFCYAKENNVDVLNLLKTHDWYNKTFITYIWEIQENYIDSSDLELLKKIIVAKPKIAIKLINNERYNSNKYKKININLLTDILTEFSDEQLEHFLNIVWPDTNEGVIFKTDNSTRNRFINNINVKLQEKKLYEIDCWYNIMIPIIFLAPFSLNAEKILRKFLSENSAILQPIIDSIKNSTNSVKLKSFISSL